MLTGRGFGASATRFAITANVIQVAGSNRCIDGYRGLSLAALAFLWVRRPHTVLDVWLMVVMCAWICDIALAALLNSGRFDVGFYAVMAFVIFGISFWGPVFAVGLISMPYVSINFAEGVRGVDRGLINMSKAYHRSEQQIFKHVVVPSVMPFVFAGVRLSFSLAWKVGTLTEVFGSSQGIGFQIRRNYQLFNMPAVIAWVLLFCAFMLLFERLVLVRLERRLFRWRQWERD